MKPSSVAALLVAAFVASGVQWAQACVTLVADLHGAAQVADRPSAKAEDRWPVQLLQCFPAGKTVMLDPGARMTLFYPATGEAIELLGPGSFELAAATVRPVSSAAAPTRLQLNTAFRDIKLDRTRLAPAGVRMRDPQLAGVLVPLEPIGVVLSADTLVFRWGPVEGVREYRFRLANARREVLLEDRAESSQLSLPSRTQLTAGERLFWQVEAKGPATQWRSRWQEFVIATPPARSLAARLDRELPSPSATERVLREVLLLQQMEVDKASQ
jgi:hypothetical protein